MTRPMLKAKRALAATLALGLVTALAACGDSSSNSAGDGPVTEITLVHSAGVNGAAVEQIVKDYTAETNIKVTTIEFSDPDYASKMKLAQQNGKPDFDAAIGIPQDVFLLTDDGDTYASIDTAKFDSAGLKGLQSGKLIGGNYMVNQDITPLAIYSKDFDKDPPSTWADFFDTEKYPGYRGLQSGGFGVPLNVIIALLGDGVQPDQLYPLDLDRAFKKLDTIKGKLTVWDAAPKSIQDVAEGNTTFSYAFSPAALGAVKSNQDVSVKLLKDTPITRAYAAVMQAGPHGPAAGNAFLAYWSRPEVQKKYSELTNYGIVLPSQPVYDAVGKENLKYAPFVPGQPQGTLLDYAYLAKDENGSTNFDTIVNRWNEWRAS